MISVADLAAFCRKTGFVFPAGDIYGGLAGFFDYGPHGVELKNNITQNWWRFFVKSRQNVVGMDGAIITNPEVWKASGHVESFNDLLVECKGCHYRVRADHLIEDTLKISAEALSAKKIDALVKKNKIKCPKCKKHNFLPTKTFNAMFNVQVGPIKDESLVSYLRPETAQSIFPNFALIQRANRLKLHFGIAQIGKAFRNEIAPRDFLFRVREFEQMEIEFFVHPKKLDECPYYNEVKNDKSKVSVWTAEAQEKNKKETKMTFEDLYKKKIVKNKWHAYWVRESYSWLNSIGLSDKNLRIRPHLKDELSFYSKATIDIEYKFPFGWKEIQGVADRTQYDLKQHAKFSKQDLTYFDESAGGRVVPHVIEPSIGVDRPLLALLFESYKKEKDRVVLSLPAHLAPVHVAVFPLLKNDKTLVKRAMLLDGMVALSGFISFYDESGSVGKRYRRMDEIGCPLCITVDHQTLKDSTVTLRDRDSMKQIRVKESALADAIYKFFTGTKFEKLGKVVK